MKSVLAVPHSEISARIEEHRKEGCAEPGIDVAKWLPFSGAWAPLIWLGQRRACFTATDRCAGGFGEPW
jgi:hypothetical protein